ncbi:MAG: type VI secretion system amidase effector protein Tae4 [Proteobacteria bacterium]|nr:type VI secretion system amidase effector protein Tae4 [Pseudomonadota bacterium]
MVIFEVSGWGDASGHVTLWDGSSCGDHCYFVHDQPGVQTTRILFWELK